MEIIYSIFNRPQDNEAELRLRIKLDIEDYVLINQFSNDTAKCEFPMQKESRIESSIFQVEENENNPDFIKLVMNWGKDTFEKKYDDDKNIYWISNEEYSITLSQEDNLSYCPDIMVKDIQDKVTGLMRYMGNIIPKNNKSCFENLLPIEYVDSK